MSGAPEQPGRALAHGMSLHVRGGVTATFPASLDTVPACQGYLMAAYEPNDVRVNRSVLFTPLGDDMPAILRDHIGPDATHPFILQCFDLDADSIALLLHRSVPSAPLGNGMLWKAGNVWRCSSSVYGPLKVDSRTFESALLSFGALFTDATVESTGPAVRA